jgi:hypothetical protein
MLHTVLRRRASGESVEQIQPDLIIGTGKRKGHSPSAASIYRALAEHDKAQAYPEALTQAHADFGAMTVAEADIRRPRHARIRRPEDPVLPEEADLRRRLQPKRSRPHTPTDKQEEKAARITMPSRCSGGELR